MDELQVFGDPARLEIAVRWRGDAERRSRRPADYGWSMGDVRIVVADQNLSANARGASRRSHASWCLLPLFDWLADHWEDLLHEGEFPWPGRSASPAAVAAQGRLDELVDAGDAAGRRRYAEAQVWRNAHALRTAARGDLFMRRYLDTVEMSWTATAPLFAPDQFRFAADPGVAYPPVRDVATPIWSLLGWAVRTGGGRVASGRDAAALARLASRLRSIESRTVVDFAAARIGREVAGAAHAALVARGVERFFAAVAMFGGLDPGLSLGDVELLADVVAAAAGGVGESPRLAALVDGAVGPPDAITLPRRAGARPTPPRRAGRAPPRRHLRRRRRPARPCRRHSTRGPSAASLPPAQASRRRSSSTETASTTTRPTACASRSRTSSPTCSMTDPGRSASAWRAAPGHTPGWGSAPTPSRPCSSCPAPWSCGRSGPRRTSAS